MEALQLLKFVGLALPSLSYDAMQHSLGFSQTSSKWDMRTAVTVSVLRKFMSPGNGRVPPIGKVQARSCAEPGVKNTMWIATATIPKPPSSDEDALRDAVCKAVDDMAPNKEEIRYTKPVAADIEVEWTGFRSEAGPLPKIGEEEKYKRLMADPVRTSETTILYVHGGAYYLADPRTHRDLTQKLAKESKGRVCSVRYRLAPQTAFPGQLIDALMVYLSLIYPPDGSMHEAVSADKIVIGGDSAGGNLAFALLQLILQLHRSAGAVPVVKFHGRDVLVPLPAGASAASGWFDISRAMPSIASNAAYDYLPPAKHDDVYARFPHEKGVWPADPPRGDLFCDLTLLDHPLASLLLAPSWETSCPLWMCVGQEMLSDEVCLVASRAAQQGVKVHFEQYEAMPHCFQLLISRLDNAKRCVRSWGDWARRCVEEPETLRTNGTFIAVKTGEEREVEVEKVGTVNFDEAWGLVKAAQLKRRQGYEKEGKAMPVPAL